MAATGRRSPPSATVALLAGITMIGLALRLPSFTDSLFGDELSTNLIAHGFGIGSVLDIVRSDQEVTPPLFFFFPWLTKGLGDVEGLRVISLLAGLATIPLTYLLGVRTVGRPAATVAAVLVALSPFQIFYATEARAYALEVLFCLAATLALLSALDDGRPRWWVVYALLVAAAAYTRYTAVFVLLALFLWAFVARPEARRPLLLANLGAVLLYLPWIPEFLDDGDAPGTQIIGTVHPLTFDAATTDLARVLIGHPFIPISDVPGNLAIWLILSGLVLGAAGLVLRLRGEWRERWWPPPAGVVLVVMLAVAAPLGAVLEDIVAPSVWLPRNLISSWPGLALMLGALVTAARAPVRIAAVVLVVGGFAIGALKMLDDDNQRPDVAAAAAFIERTGEPGSPVVELPQVTPGPQTNLEAALAPTGEPVPRDRQIISLAFPTIESRLQAVREGPGLLGARQTLTEQQVASRAARVAGAGTLFLVTSGDPTLEQLRIYPGPVADFLAALPPRFHEVESRNFPGFGILSVKVFVLEGGG